MIDYKITTLDNGLTVIAHRDNSTRMCAVNMLYKVGARNENPQLTGMAHLFEHLMFGGSKNAPDFDAPLQMACGENNAFTNNDYTDYYVTLPSENIETAFWLEADRMVNLNLEQALLNQEKRVVIEEFKQRYINQPYGDVWPLLRPLVYKVHPYMWPTIGKNIEHIEKVDLDAVHAFYNTYYRPDNAILSVASNLEADEVFALADKWFSKIKCPDVDSSLIQNIPAEPLQSEYCRLEVERDVPATVITHVYKMGGRLSREFNEADVVSDLLSGGTSSRLYRRLVQDSQILSSVNAYVSGEIDPGMFVVTGTTPEGVGVAEAEAAIAQQLDDISNNLVGDYELTKVRNRYEAGTLFGELNIMNKAMNMGFYQMLGDIDVMNQDIEIYNSVGKADIVMNQDI
ncbi:MAG: pitrilysin family protein, partial [Rikenellaceae bacterium]